MWIATALILAAILTLSAQIHRAQKMVNGRFATMLEIVILLTAVDKTRRESIDDLDKRIRDYRASEWVDPDQVIADLREVTRGLNELGTEPTDNGPRHAYRDQP